MKLTNALLYRLIEIAWAASDKIMAIYEQTITFSLKSDNSPVTMADLASHNIITDALSELLPSIPIVSEENTELINLDKTNYSTFWLIDPLDGTKEFIHRNGEFSINIALIDKNEPQFGLICSPMIQTIYLGIKHNGAFKYSRQGNKILLTDVKSMLEGLSVLHSRSHDSPLALMPHLPNLPIKEFIPLGSALKFCALAEGKAHVYPRLSGSMEWDTAAGHALLMATGGRIETFDKKSLAYGKKQFKNPPFIAYANCLI